MSKMNLQNSKNRSNQLLEFRNQLTSILVSLKTVLERKALNQEDAKLVAIAYKNAKDLITVIKDLLSKNELDKEGNALLELLKKELKGIIIDLPVDDDKEILPVYQEIQTLGSLEIFMETKHEMTDSDQNWVYQIGQSIENEISNFDFNAETLAGQIFISRRQLDRRLKLLTGLTTSQFIRKIRMEKAEQLIKEKKLDSIKAIAFKVGIKSVSHFSKQYKARFKKSPSEDLTAE